MNTILEPLRALVRRKLWPVALLLVGALVAAPVLLAKQPEATAVAPAVKTTETDDAISASFVSADDDTVTETTTLKRRRTLGAKKDPFEPAPLPKAKKSSKKKAAKTTATTTVTKSDDTSHSSSSSASGGSAATTASPAATPAPTPAPTKTIPANTVRVRFGTTETDPLPLQLLKRDTALPSDDDPAFVFDRLSNDGKTAIFNLTGTVTVEGDGKCLPTPEDCQILKLTAGETAFLTVTSTDASGTDIQTQYELDVARIYDKATTVAVKGD